MDVSRVELYRHLPLAAPFSVHIFPSYFCNFRCSYCLHSLTDDILSSMRFKRQMMPWETYKKAIDDVALFPDKLKALIFAGHGEPLTHPDIAKMVAYAKEKAVAGRVEIVTNAALLSRSMSQSLIEAGLDRLKISVQGTSALKYKEISGIEFDFEAFIANLRWFYEHKTATNVYIKIIDVALGDKNDEELFHELFTPYADQVAIEYAIPFVNAVDYNQYGKKMDTAKQGHKTREIRVCSMPFYMAVIGPDGSVLPCCSTEVPVCFGNILKDSLADLWSSQGRGEFLKSQLKNRFSNTVCARCSVPNFGLQEGDYLDERIEELLPVYSQRQ